MAEKTLLDRLTKWRTVIVVLFALVVVLLGLVLATKLHASNEMFAAFATTCATLAGLVSVKSAVEHLANGGGVKGALRSLLTENTPPPPSPESRP